MADLDTLQPRASWQLRHALAAQVVTHALPALPIGYWQRRIAARAFSLDVMPTVPRDSQHVHTWRLPGVPSLWMMSTEAMSWGLIPWSWRMDTRTEIAEARSALRRVLAASRTPCCAAVFVTSAAPDTPRLHMPRLRLTGMAASTTVVGTVTVDELVEVFDDAARDLARHASGALAAHASRRLRLLSE